MRGRQAHRELVDCLARAGGEPGVGSRGRVPCPRLSSAAGQPGTEWLVIPGASARERRPRSNVPALEPGGYAACWLFIEEAQALELSAGLPPAQRVGGHLPSGGELVLDVPPVSC